MEKFGVMDAKSYFQRMKLPIAISILVCACIGASQKGMAGFLAGALAGLFAPLALVWLGVVLSMIVIFMAVYCAAWAVILWIGWWILHS